MPFYDPFTNEKIEGNFQYNLAVNGNAVNALRFERKQGEPPAFLDTVQASLGEYSAFYNLPDFIKSQARKLKSRDENFNPYEGLAFTQYAPYIDEFTYATDEEDKNLIKANIDSHLENQKVLMQSGLLGVGTSMVAGLLGPGSLLPIGATANALIKGGSLLKNATKGAFIIGSLGAVGETIDQSILQASSDVRTWGDSVQDIAGATILSGLVGGVIGLNKARSINLSRKIEEVFQLPSITERMHGDEIIAPSWKDAEIQLKREGLIKNLPKFSPSFRTLSSDISASRKASANIAETGIILEGEYIPTAIETITRFRIGKISADIQREFLKEFSNFINRIGSSKVSASVQKFFRSGNVFDDFSKEISSALRRGDVSEIPEVQRLVSSFRKQFNEITQEALDLDLFGIKANKIARAENKFENFNKENKSLENKFNKKINSIDQNYNVERKNAIKNYKNFDIARDNLNKAKKEIIVDQETRSRKISEAQKEYDKVFKNSVSTKKIIEKKLKDNDLQLEKYYKIKDGYVSKIKTLQSNIESLKKNLENIKKEPFESKKIKNSQLSKINKKIIKKEDQIKKTISTLDTTTAPSARKKLQERIDKYRNELQEFKNELKKINDTIYTRDSAKSKAIKYAETRIKKENRNLDLLKSKQENHLKDIDKKIIDIDRQISSLNKNLKEIEDSIAIKQRKLDKAKNKIYEDKLAKAKAITKAEKEIGPLKQKFEQSKKILIDLKKNKIKEINLREKRAEELNKLKKDIEIAKGTKLTLEDLNLGNTAKSYFPRSFDKAKLRNNPIEFKNYLSDYISGHYKVSVEEANLIANDIYKKIMGVPEGRILAYDPYIVERGPLKARTLDIPDEILEPYLINDSINVFEKYLKTMINDIEIAKRFGDVNATEAIKAIRKEADELERLNPSKSAKINRKANSDIEDVQRMINRLRGLEGLAYEDNATFTVLKTIRNWNNSRLMGTLGSNSFTDIGQIVLQNGFFRTLGNLFKILLLKITDPKAYKAFKEDMESMAIGIDALVNSRKTLYDIGTNEEIGNKIYQYSRRFADFTFKASLVSNLDSFTKKIAGYTAGNRIRRNVLTGFDSLNNAEKRWMSNLGINKDAYESIASQMNKFSREESRFRIFNTQKWTDQKALDSFTNALKKTESLSVITPGVGDAPLIYDHPAWQLLAQYKRFALSAMNRSLIPALQRTDAGVLAGITTMATGAAMRETLLMLISGKNPNDIEISEFMKRALLRMDILAFIPDLWGIAEVLLGQGKYNENVISVALGPTSGLLGRDIPNLFKAIKGSFDGNALTKQQVRSIRVLMPFQNLYYFNWLLTSAENSINENVGNF